MSALIDMQGEVFGRLTVISRAPNSNVGGARWHCVCSCGVETIVWSRHLRSGNVTSCGCYRRELHTTHGLSDLPEYASYMMMLARCNNSNNSDYHRYGGRGICVCNRWNNFKLFLADMGPRSSSEYSIDRINNDGDYEPGNCRWATRVEQQNNKRTNHIINYEGKSQTLAQWARATGIYSTTLRYKLNQGWSVHRALTEPV